MTLTLKIVNQFFCMTHHLMIIHYQAKFGKKWLSRSRDTGRTQLDTWTELQMDWGSGVGYNCASTVFNRIVFSTESLTDWMVWGCCGHFSKTRTLKCRPVQHGQSALASKMLRWGLVLKFAFIPIRSMECKSVPRYNCTWFVCIQP